MATNNPAALNAQFEDRLIPWELLDEPPDAQRETMEEQELADLALSIGDVGLLEPLIVMPNGQRYTIRAGHRRYIACGIAQYSPVPCRVVVAGIVDDLAMMEAENAFREDVNVIEQACFYQRLLIERCGNDVDMLVIRVRRKREFVEDRLNLLLGHPNVVDALRNKRISLAVARELNKVKDPNRLLILLDTAVQQGATARQVNQWRRDADNLQAIVLPDVDSPGADGDGTAPVAAFSMECLFCESGEHQHMMEMVYLHAPCKGLLLRMLQRAAQPAAAGEN